MKRSREELNKSLDSSPVFFTGLTNKKIKIENKKMCKLCNGTLTYNNTSDVCGECVEITSTFEQSKQLRHSSHNNSPEKISSVKPRNCHSSDRPIIFNTPSSSSKELQNISSMQLKEIIHTATISLPSTPKLKSWDKSRNRKSEPLETTSKYSPYSRAQTSNISKSSSSSEIHTAPVIKNQINPPEYQTPSPSRWSSQKIYSNPELSIEIWNLYHKNKQTDDVFNSKMKLRETMHSIISTRFPDCGLFVVGSSMTGLGVKSSDIDMCLMLTPFMVDQEKEAVNILYILKQLFRDYRFLCNVQVIPAKVPIIKFIDSVSGTEVDININNDIGIRNTQLLSSYARIDKRLPPLVVLSKLWGKKHNINDAKFNSLSSYSMVLMLIHYLQYRCQPPVLPCLQKIQPDKYLPHVDVRNLKVQEDLPDFVSENKEDLSGLFIGFLKYFAHEFNYEKSVMSVRLGHTIPREEVEVINSPNNKKAHWKYIGIEEPFDRTNTARSVFNEKVFKYIQYIFEESLNRLENDNANLSSLFC